MHYEDFFDFLTTKVSHGSVATQLWCGGLFNKHMTATCPQSLPVKKNFLRHSAL